MRPKLYEVPILITPALGKRWRWLRWKLRRDKPWGFGIALADAEEAGEEALLALAGSFPPVRLDKRFAVWRRTSEPVKAGMLAVMNPDGTVRPAQPEDVVPPRPPPFIRRSYVSEPDHPEDDPEAWEDTIDR